MNYSSLFSKLLRFVLISILLIVFFNYFISLRTFQTETTESKDTTYPGVPISTQSAIRIPFTPTPAVIKKEPIAQPTKNPSPKSETNYELKPCKDDIDGCYEIIGAPLEEMATSDELNSAVNGYRRSHNLNQIEIDSQICKIAAQRALEIESNFSHQGFTDHAEKGDYDFLGFTSIAENLWQGSFSAVHIVEYGWDKSEGHRSNLQGNWSRGCGAVYKNNAVFLFVN